MPQPDVPFVSTASAYGYLGVNIFFVISGYVIFLTEMESTPSRFLASRISRLYPAFLVCLLITYGAHLFWGGPRDVSSGAFFANLTMIPQWFGYLEMDGTYWSLEREIVFYGFIMGLLLIGWLRHIRWFIAGWLILATLESYQRVWVLELYLLANWAPFFSAGMLLRLMQKGDRSRLTYVLLSWSIVLSLYLTWREAAFKLHIPMPHISVVIMLLSYALFAVIALGKLSLKPSRWILLGSAYSYPLYLLHHDLGYYLAKTDLLNGLSGGVQGLVLLVFMLLLTATVHHQIEQRFARPLRALVLRLCESVRGLLRHPA
jgi:peptidoglycan/LPS O-acetylase OafA/YrhL